MHCTTQDEAPGSEDWFPVSKETIAEIRAVIAKDVPAVRDVIAERQRQFEQEGWTQEHDDNHFDGELARAGASYAIGSLYAFDQGKPLWPWHLSEWKSKDRRRDLVRGAALIIAEIERLDRKETSGTPNAAVDALPSE